MSYKSYKSYKSLEFSANLKLYVEKYELNKNMRIEEFYISRRNLEILNNFCYFKEQQKFLKKLLIDDDYHLSDDCNLSIGFDKLPINDSD